MIIYNVFAHYKILKSRNINCRRSRWLGWLRVLVWKYLLARLCGPGRRVRFRLFSARSSPGFDASCAVGRASGCGCRILAAFSGCLLSSSIDTYQLFVVVLRMAESAKILRVIALGFSQLLGWIDDFSAKTKCYQYDTSESSFPKPT